MAHGVINAKITVVWPEGKEAWVDRGRNLDAPLPSSGRSRPSVRFKPNVMLPAYNRLCKDVKAASWNLLFCVNSAPANNPVAGSKMAGPPNSLVMSR